MANRSNQERDYDPGEQISLGVRTNAEFIAACHRIAERYDMSTASWMRSVLAPVVAKELGISPAMIEPFGGFDVLAPGTEPVETLEDQISRATPEQQKLVRALLATATAGHKSTAQARQINRQLKAPPEQTGVTRRR